ncbi:hypothetical protein LXL04_031344 [Taraxacum kok-saghyz]
MVSKHRVAMPEILFHVPPTLSQAALKEKGDTKTSAEGNCFTEFSWNSVERQTGTIPDQENISEGPRSRLSKTKPTTQETDQNRRNRTRKTETNRKPLGRHPSPFISTTSSHHFQRSLRRLPIIQPPAPIAAARNTSAALDSRHTVIKKLPYSCDCRSIDLCPRLVRSSPVDIQFKHITAAVEEEAREKLAAIETEELGSSERSCLDEVSIKCLKFRNHGFKPKPKSYGLNPRTHETMKPPHETVKPNPLQTHWVGNRSSGFTGWVYPKPIQTLPMLTPNIYASTFQDFKKIAKSHYQGYLILHLILYSSMTPALAEEVAVAKSAAPRASRAALLPCCD